jgi:hypothetical protein
MTTTFPAHVLGIKVELLLNGVWTDVSGYVQQRADINITNMGRTDWTSGMQAAQVTLTLKNTDGRFTPKNTAGAYYPNIARNVQIRIYVDSESSTLVVYQGYRFWGEVASWPVKWDSSGKDVYCEITANGIWRRLSQSKITLGSPYYRYVMALAGSDVPRGYWSFEDGNNSVNFVASVAGVANATFTGSPSFASCPLFRGSNAVVTLNAGFITCTVPAGGTPTNNTTRWLLSVPAKGDAASGTTNWNICEVKSSGTVDKFEVYLNYAGTLLIQLRNAAGTVIASATTTTNVKNHPYLISMELTPSAPNVLWAVRLIDPGNGTPVESKTGSVAGSINVVQTVKFGRASALQDTAVGHCSVHYSVPTIANTAVPLNGHIGERALDRFTRLCTQEGIGYETIGNAVDTPLLGPQLDRKLTEELQSIEDTDCGLLSESRTKFGLCYRTLKSMADQAVALTLSYSAATLSGELGPVYDDQLTRNDVTVTNWTGGTYESVLTVGPMSIIDPSVGVGIGTGYEFSRNINVQADASAQAIATWYLNLGTVDEVRFPKVELDLRRSELVALFATIPGMRPGDFFRITNPPSFLRTTSIDQLVWGYTETLNAFEWRISYNAVPESPYVTGFTPGTVQLHQLPGGSSVTSQGDFVKSVAALLANGSITSSMLNNGITSVSLGGIRTTIAAAAPTDPAPNAGDIWINSATGQLSRYNGATWDPITFDGSATIQAASIESAQIAADTIVGSNISGATITAGLLAAGIVVTGIVDATNIEARTYVATSSGGEFLAYDTDPPSAGHLINAIAGSSGNDDYTNPYPEGFFGQQLTLQNQSVYPPAFTGASVFFSSVNGRPRYLASSGVNAVIERSEINVSQFTVGNTTTPGVISAPLNYVANEGNQSSEFEIEADGIITTANAGQTPQTLTFQLEIDGSVPTGAGPVTWGAVFLPVANLTFAYIIRARLMIVTTGSPGTANIVIDANLARRAINMGSQTTPLVSASGGEVGFGKSYDSAADHVLRLYAFWGGNSTGQTLTTYRSRISRRM